MSLKSRLNVESKGMLAALVFYAVAGIALLALLPMTEFPPHLGMIGAFSLISAFGVLKKRNWTIWFVILTFFTATTFSVYMIYYYLFRNAILGASIMLFLALTWIFSGYIASKRKTLET